VITALGAKNGPQTGRNHLSGPLIERMLQFRHIGQKQVYRLPGALQYYLN
jgi:hypothetical protein